MSLWGEDITRMKRPVPFILATSRPYRIWVAGAFVLGGTAAGVYALLPLVYKNLIDAVISASSIGVHSTTVFWVVVYLCVISAHLVLWRLASLCIVFWSTGMRATARYALSAYTIEHSSAFFEGRFAGSVANKINHAIDGGRHVASSVVYEFWPFAVGLCVNFYITFSVSVSLGLVFTLWLAVVIPLNVFLTRKKIPRTVAAQQSETGLRGETIDLMTNIRAMHEYARRPFELDRLQTSIVRRRKIGLRNWLFGEMILSINAITQIVFTAAMVSIAVWAMMEGVFSPGVVVLAIALSISVGRDLFVLGNQLNTVAEHWGELEEGLEEILNPHDILNPADSHALTINKGAMAFNSVTFQYHTDSPVISRFSLSIPHGQKLGLVGKSGAGKSTIIKLLLRHYEVSEGNITIDGHDISKTTQESVRNSIAVVPQDPLLFHRTIKENIAYGKLGATDEEVHEAARLAQAHDFILALPHGYDTVVGERGVKLSGGERQRVALARALLKPAKILVLDEATSSLDSESEIAIQKALYALMEGKTVLAIAHRLSTLREMDRILVLRDGNIVEDGTHAELLARGNLYAELWAHQSGGYIKDEE